ncbi:hypothetical protein Hamer_G028250 [Homarus americanus]|uniref:Uncharacterized protein n=1 Tax=Homarus americanus TaxID=6706 RepID=A0A8J5K9L0_HOMAM|nr:hypothetical protein Hamer_G028250 [Homarus americanus]
MYPWGFLQHYCLAPCHLMLIFICSSPGLMLHT